MYNWAIPMSHKIVLPDAKVEKSRAKLRHKANNTMNMYVNS